MLAQLFQKIQLRKRHLVSGGLLLAGVLLPGAGAAQEQDLRTENDKTQIQSPELAVDLVGEKAAPVATPAPQEPVVEAAKPSEPAAVAVEANKQESAVESNPVVAQEPAKSEAAPKEHVVVKSNESSTTVLQQRPGTIVITVQTVPSNNAPAAVVQQNAAVVQKTASAEIAHEHSGTCCTPLEPPCCAKDPRVCYTPPNATIGVDFLYFKAIEDTLRFSDKIPIAGFTPVVKGIEPDWSYDPGVRGQIGVSLGGGWELAGVWTWFRAHPPGNSAADPISGLWTNLDQPVFNNSVGNQFADFVQGNWDLRMNVWDLEFRKPFCIGNCVMLQPVLGVQGCELKQTFHVQYSGIVLSDAVSETPQTVRCKSKVWGVGPEIGLEGRLLAVRRLDLFFRMAFSSMAGMFDLKTVYEDLLFQPSSTTISMKNKISRLFSQIQLQAAAAKKWNITCNSSIEIVVGWETQVWFRQSRWDFFNTISRPPEGGDLTLHGPFARMNWDF